MRVVTSLVLTAGVLGLALVGTAQARPADPAPRLCLGAAVEPLFKGLNGSCNPIPHGSTAHECPTCPGYGLDRREG
ncbi:hypothetical protein ACFFQW_11760 [Umezawaea endophytica]|uniref:Secreted protein n=1 Tax=Umezawaea endophytica TaxID=1654476 RepID=A0A9X2VUV5_9PSEU|nr:hypothetical protein [Umezawaea endophytica]MCS7482484.1 hypothetical protein [Umezawaea endophytica]